MRYAKDHKQRTRARIVEMASYGLCKNGADGLGLIDLMKLAGLTHGGFYSHFDSREALVIEALICAMDRTISRWRELTEGKHGKQTIDLILDSYLSHLHRSNPGRGCAIPALGADIARSSSKTRRMFARKLEEMIEQLARLLPLESQRAARPVAISMLATMIGSIVLSRAVSDIKMSDEILVAARHALRSPERAGGVEFQPMKRNYLEKNS
jgi:TetR/AcrR family transcriptional repressor of nem operon